MFVCLCVCVLNCIFVVAGSKRNKHGGWGDVVWWPFGFIWGAYLDHCGTMLESFWGHVLNVWGLGGGVKYSFSWKQLLNRHCKHIQVC